MLLNRFESWEFSLLALCIWREARGEPYQGKVGVAWSIRNRVEHPSWWGRGSYAAIILKPWQYSSFNRNDPNATEFPDIGDASWSECLAVAEDVYSSILPDPTGGATHYCTAALATSPKHPAWITGAQFKVQLGNHMFYLAK